MSVKIGIILGSTRPGRNGEAVAKWVLEQASTRTDATYELVDLADFALPLLDEPIPASMGQYVGPHTQAWAAKVAEFDGYIFVTPEYNHSTSGVLKNAIDYVYAEWNNKAAGFVGYGSVGAARAVEQLRQIVGELQIADVRAQVAFTLTEDFENYSTFVPRSQHESTVGMLFDQVESWSTAMQSVRVPALESVSA